jgi:hypothetical protein
MKIEHLSIFISVFIASSAWAQIVVVRGTYTNVARDENVVSRAQIVAKSIASAVRNSDARPVISEDKTCVDESCLKQTAAARNADFGLAAHVKEDFGEFSFTLLGFDTPIQKEGFVSFSETLNAVTAAVRASLEKKSASSDEPLLEKPFLFESLESRNIESPPLETPPPAPPAPRATSGGVRPAAFWSSLGITLGLVAGSIALESAGYKKLKDARDKPFKDRTEADRDFQTPMRITESALLGGALAGAVVTAVLGVRAFKKNNEAPAIVHMAPAVEDNGGGLLLKGTF